MDIMELDAEISRVQRELEQARRRQRNGVNGRERLAQVAEQIRSKEQSASAVPEKALGEVSKKLAHVHVSEGFKQNYYNQVKRILFGSPYANMVDRMWAALRDAQQASLDCEDFVNETVHNIQELQETLDRLKAEREQLNGGGGIR